MGAHARQDPETRDRGHDPPGYTPRRPRDGLLYAVLQEHLETFLARARARHRIVPRFVERELRGYLQCGILAHGFLRVHCDACGHDRLVPFSCKGRGFCPSCGGRRMADTAAHLVDRVLPEAPVRQWVLSLPFTLRYRMGYDARLTGEVLRLFLRAVFASLRRRGRSATAKGGRLHGGAVTFIQRFGDALNLNVHFHTLAIDGVYEARGRALRFRPLPPPDDAEVERVAARVARNLARLLERRGLGGEGGLDDLDGFSEDQPLLAQLYGAAIQGRVATGRRAGQPLLRLGDQVDVEDLPAQAARCARVAGLSLHANVAVPARDRSRLERLCRYAARPPLATERLSRLPDGRLLYQLRRRWRDGTTHVTYQPVELIERLAALVPPPRVHQVRYHGVLAPCAGQRQRIVPARLMPVRGDGGCGGHDGTDAAGKGHEPRDTRTVAPSGSEERSGGSPGRSSDRPARAGGSETPPGLDLDAFVLGIRPRPYSWPELMQRVFAADVLACPRCHGRLRIMAAIHPPFATRAILEHLGLPPRGPPVAPAREESDLPLDPADPI